MKIGVFTENDLVDIAVTDGLPIGLPDDGISRFFSFSGTVGAVGVFNTVDQRYHIRPERTDETGYGRERRAA